MAAYHTRVKIFDVGFPIYFPEYWKLLAAMLFNIGFQINIHGWRAIVLSFFPM